MHIYNYLSLNNMQSNDTSGGWVYYQTLNEYSNLISFLYISFNSYYLKKFAVTAPIKRGFYFLLLKSPNIQHQKKGGNLQKGFFSFSYIYYIKIFWKNQIKRCTNKVPLQSYYICESSTKRKSLYRASLSVLLTLAVIFFKS